MPWITKNKLKYAVIESLFSPLFVSKILNNKWACRNLFYVSAYGEVK